MSREIKFEYVCLHTYAGDTRILSHVIDLGSIEDTIDVVDLIRSEIDPCTCCFTESKNHCDCDSILDHGEFEVIARRQFTGPKDRNGVEIYEGDIASCPDGFRYQCIMDNRGCFVFCNINDKHDFYFSDDMDWEVIGNTHQNPGLLK